MSGDFDGLDVQLLEPLLQDFVRLIGLRDTMAIVKRFGGRQLYIGADGASLLDVIAAPKAAAIGRYVGQQGSRLFIPKALPALRHLRDQRLARRPEASVRDTAVELGIGERRAWQILKRLRTDGGAPETPRNADTRTPDLFG